MQMQIRLDEYIIDLYQSFKCKKNNIDEQLDRDFHRLIFYFNASRIMTKADFYRMLDNLPYRRIHKQILWVLPTQVSLFIFYKFLADTFAKDGYMVCEIQRINLLFEYLLILCVKEYQLKLKKILDILGWIKKHEKYIQLVIFL